MNIVMNVVDIHEGDKLFNFKRYKPMKFNF